MEHRIFHLLRKTSTKIILVVIQILLLVALALSHYATVWFGQDIKLRTVPVDPRDAFYGDYAVMQYDISTLPASLWKDKPASQTMDSIKQHAIIYVVLRPNEDIAPIYAAEGFYTTTKPDVDAHQIVLKAKVQYTFGIVDNNTDQKQEPYIRVNYGLEKYYVPENTGKALEEQARKGQLIALVKISKWSGPVIKELMPANQ